MSSPFEEPTDRMATPAPLVTKIREEVNKWRANGYLGASETTNTLLNFWFNEEHKQNDRFFRYYFCQREAIETLIYLYEVKKFRRLEQLVKAYDTTKKVAYNPNEDLFAKYCFKMATGTGKTKVMSLAIVWSFFKNTIDKDEAFAKNFLIMAPNIAVFERLRSDFEDGKVFKSDPLIPEELQSYWDVDFVMADEMTSRSSKGRVYLTNVQKLYERSTSNNLNPIEKLVGKKPSETKTAFEVIFNDILKSENLAIFNDEAHHVWDPDLKWNKIINNLYESFSNSNKMFSFQLDFSATPKRQDTGSLFQWIIVDYHLMDAIKNGVVKMPIIGDIENAREVPASRADIRYRDYIEAGIRRLNKYKERYAPLGKTPVIFFMAMNTKEAEELADFLNKKTEFKNKVLLIHTNLKGNISDKEWTALKEEVKNLDFTDGRYLAVVSVLMLREGWDVKSVNVIVGLRPYTSKADILPEQTLGRGLRLLFGPESGYQETVDIFGSSGFITAIDQKLQQEGVKVQHVKEKDLQDVINIFVDTNKKKFDIEIPLITQKYTRMSRPLNDLKIEDLPKNLFSLDINQYSITKTARGKNILTKKQMWKETWKQPSPENFEGIVSYFSSAILKECKIPSRTNELIPKVDDYITKYLFDRKLNEKDKKDDRFLNRLVEPEIFQLLLKIFPEEINKLTIAPQKVKLENRSRRASQVQPFLTRKMVYKAEKCILNLVPVANDLELRFCGFLDRAKDVKKFIKNDVNLNFYIEYVNSSGGISYYQPDFVVETTDGTFLVETKGFETEDVPLKDRRAVEWCKDVSKLTKNKWSYLKVKQDAFDVNINIGTFEKFAKIMQIYNKTR
jgi:type III restriction enzyme